MSTVLENVPKEMILIFKTNDLLRGLETTLDVRPDANAFITMSELVIKINIKLNIKKIFQILSASYIRV